MAPVSTQQLLERARSGDRAALNALVKHCYPYVWGWLSPCAHDKELRNDLAQDVFVVFCRKEIYKFDSIGQMMGWLRRAARNIWLHHDHNPRQRGRRNLSEEELAEIVGRELEPSKQAELEDFTARLRLQIEELPEHLRNAIRLCAEHDLTSRQIAEKLAVPEGTARYWVFEARRLLLERLQATDPDLLAWIHRADGNAGAE